MALALVLVGVVVTAAHWPVLSAQALSLDDPDYVTKNPLVTHPTWGSAERFFREVLHPSTVRGYYLPLTMTSLMLDYAMGGRAEDLHIFHRTNLALHVFNTLLIVLFLQRLFGAITPAAIVGLMFGLHPLTVEPTAWIGERKTLLATLFALGCLLAHLEYCRRKRGAWLTASVVLYLLALLSKPTVMMLPLLLLLLDWWPLNRLGWRAVFEKTPFFVLFMLLGVVTLVSQDRAAGFVHAPESDLPWPLRASYLLAFYLGKIVWPNNLSCAYPEPPPFSLSNPVVPLSAVLVFGLTVLLVRLSKRVPGPLAGWSFFVIAIAPTLGLIRYTWVVASDKYVYFPALGMLMVLAAGLSAAWRSPRFGVAAKVAVLAVLSCALVAEARGVRITLRNWSDSITLYRHMEHTAPDAPVVHGQLGVLLEEASQHDDAIRQLRRALELAPNYRNAHYNLGAMLVSEGRLEEAIQHLRAADTMEPNDPPTLFVLGMALRLSRQPAEAAMEFRRALSLKPDHAEARSELGSVLVVLGRPEEAVDEFRKAVSLAPANAVLHHRLSMALLIRGGDPLEAVEHLREAIRHQPGWAEPYNALAWLRATSPDATVRDTTEALRLGLRAAELTGGRDAKVLDTVAAAQAAAGRFAEAVRTQRDAIALASRVPADTLARGMRERMKMYERREPYRESARPGATPAS